MGGLKVDRFDLRLMALLFEDGRASIRRQARKVGLSESACRARLKALEESGLILGYNAVIAFDRLGALQSWVDVTLVDDSSAVVAKFEALAQTDPSIAGSWLVEGEAQFRLLVISASYDDWLAFSERMTAERDVVKEISKTLIYKFSPSGEEFPNRILPELVRDSLSTA